jgi:hypothetical protein
MKNNSKLLFRDIGNSVSNLLTRELDTPLIRKTETASEYDEIRSLLKTNGLPDTEKDAKRVITFRGSTDHLDRYKTVFSLRGWNFINYRNNPVFLYQHNRDCMADSVQMPVGRSIKEWTVLPEYRKAKKDTIKVKRHERDEDGEIISTREDEIPNPENHVRVNPISSNSADDGTGMFQLVYFPEEAMSDSVFRAFDINLMSAVSVGCRPTLTAYSEDLGPDLREALGNPHELYMETELFELSAVTLPGNPKAQKVKRDLALSRGLTIENIKLLGWDDQPVTERFGDIKSLINRLNKDGPELARIILEMNTRFDNLETTFKVLDSKLDRLLSANASKNENSNSEDAEAKEVLEKIRAFTNKIK